MTQSKPYVQEVKRNLSTPANKILAVLIVDFGLSYKAAHAAAEEAASFLLDTLDAYRRKYKEEPPE